MGIKNFSPGHINNSIIDWTWLVWGVEKEREREREREWESERVWERERER